MRTLGATLFFLGAMLIVLSRVLNKAFLRWAQRRNPQVGQREVEGWVAVVVLGLTLLVVGLLTFLGI